MGRHIGLPLRARAVNDRPGSHRANRRGGVLKADRTGLRSIADMIWFWTSDSN